MCKHTYWMKGGMKTHERKLDKLYVLFMDSYGYKRHEQWSNWLKKKQTHKQKTPQKIKRMVLLCRFVRQKAVCIKSTTQDILVQRTFLLAMGNWEELMEMQMHPFVSQFSSPTYSLSYRAALSSIHLKPFWNALFY